MGRVRVEDCDRELLGGRLRGAREAHGMSREALADELGVTAQIVEAWERGAEFPDARGVTGAAAALRMDVAELLGDEGSARVRELAAASGRELRNVYGGLCLCWAAVIVMEMAVTLGLGRAPWYVCAVLMVPAAWLLWRALSAERDRGLRTARGLADYLERGARPKDDETPLAILGWALKLAPLALMVEAVAGVAG